jgi:hypothetical protein
MAVTSGRTIKAGGTSTAFANEATTKVTANTVYQITDATKRVLDPAVAVTVEVDADGAGGGGYAVAAASGYTFDYLYGKVTFTADQGSAALVRVSGSYLPTVAVAKVTESNVSVSRDAPDATTMDSGVYREKQVALVDLTGSITSLELAQYDHDPGAGTIKFISLIQSGAPWLYEELSGSVYFRAWVVTTGVENKGAVGDVNSMVVNFALASQRAGPAGPTTAACGWGT